MDRTAADLATALLARLDGVRETGPGRYVARCPAHQDRAPSLSIREADDRLLIHCHSGCQPEDVLDAIGMTWADMHTGDRWQAAEHAAVMTASALAAKQAAREAARTGINARLERLVLRFTADAIRNGETLTTYDLARAEVARERLQATEGTA